MIVCQLLDLTGLILHRDPIRMLIVTSGAICCLGRLLCPCRAELAPLFRILYAILGFCLLYVARRLGPLRNTFQLAED